MVLCVVYGIVCKRVRENHRVLRRHRQSGRAQDEKERKWTPALALAPKFFSEKTAVLAEYGCKRTVTAFSVQH